MNNCYKFITQAREIHEQYLSTINNLPIENDTKDFEDIPEPLIEVPIDLIPIEKSALQTKDSPIATNSVSLIANDIKTEPALLDCIPNSDETMNDDKLQTNDIKEEKPELLVENTDPKLNEKEKVLTLAKDHDEQKDLADDPTYEEERYVFHEKFPIREPGVLLDSVPYGIHVQLQYKL